MAEKTRPLEDVTVITCLYCGQELVVDKKPTTTDYECCKCAAIIGARIYKNGKIHIRMKKTGVK